MAQITDEPIARALRYMTHEAICFGWRTARATNLTDRSVQTAYNGVASVTFAESVTEKEPITRMELAPAWRSRRC